MNYCPNCGSRLSEGSKFCANCGVFLQQPAAQSNATSSVSERTALLEKLSSRLHINGVVWIAIACLQILIGLGGSWFVLIVGVVNIISAVQDIRFGKQVLTNPRGIVQTMQPLASTIVTLIYNLVLGGIVGVLGSVYYLVFVRGFVMENRSKFLAMEQGDAICATKSSAENEPVIVVLTEEEAKTGTTKKIQIEGLQKALSFTVPQNTKDGTVFRLPNCKTQTTNGETVRKDVYIRVSIHK